MYDFFFSSAAAWYTVPALVGTIFFAIRLKLMLLGLSAEIDIDPDVGPDSGEAFQILSIQTLAAFAMGFGWGGLGALRGFGWDGPVVAVVAVICGVGMVWLLAILLKAVADLQSSGNIGITQAVGKEGEVYATIQAGGRGQVRLVVTDRLRTYNAVAADGSPVGEDLPTGTRVRVISANPDNTLTVVRA
jgi:membrane protein implicated in regulation of membrane protease activity